MGSMEQLTKELVNLASEDSDDSKYLSFGEKYFGIIPVITGPDFSKVVVQVKRFENELLMECQREVETMRAQEEMSLHSHVVDYNQKMKAIAKQMQKRRRAMKQKFEKSILNDYIHTRNEIEKRRIFEHVRENREFLAIHKEKTEKTNHYLKKLMVLESEMENTVRECLSQDKSSRNPVS